jgi:hypothetical protein
MKTRRKYWKNACRLAKAMIHWFIMNEPAAKLLQIRLMPKIMIVFS